jgi:hypothetical protein
MHIYIAKGNLGFWLGRIKTYGLLTDYLSYNASLCNSMCSEI